MTKDTEMHDLEWLALCYAAGELDPSAAEQFEARLAGDQQAREALAGAVELMQTVAAVEAQSQTCVLAAQGERSSWNTRLSWMAVGGLAAALVAMLWSGVVDPVVRRMNSGSKYNLAVAWQQTGSEIDSVKASGLWPSGPAIEEDDDRQVDFYLVSHESGDEAWLSDAPSWMTAAVYSVSEQADLRETVQ
jgi:hypothetical protein